MIQTHKMATKIFIESHLYTDHIDLIQEMKTKSTSRNDDFSLASAIPCKRWKKSCLLHILSHLLEGLYGSNTLLFQTNYSLFLPSQKTSSPR